MNQLNFRKNLRQAEWLLKAETQQVFELLDGADGRIRAVGGIVRDSLMNRVRPDADIDFATEWLPDEVMTRAKAANLSCYPTGIDHGTVTLQIGGQTFEITTLRQDIETDGRHAKVAFGLDWTRDAERRDFTFNALYMEMDGTLYDPLGGLDDCLTGKVIFIGDPDQRIAEDRLRVFRFFRFSASHGAQNFDAAGLAACTLAATDLGQVSAERIGAEMRRILGLQRCAITLEHMVAAGILPLSDELVGQFAKYEACTDHADFIGRLALLIGGEKASRWQTQWRLSNREIKQALTTHRAANLLGANQIGETAYRFADLAKTSLPVAATLFDWSRSKIRAVSAKLATSTPPPFPISGQDLLQAGRPAGPALGEELQQLEQMWIESEFQLSRTELLELISE